MTVKMNSDWLLLVLVFLTAIGIASCISSGTVAEGGIGGTGVSMGTVSGFGSIWVNGVHFETTGTEVVIEGESVGTDEDGSQIGSMLSEGMVVTVEGRINTDGVSGTAERVSYTDNLEGPIEGAPTANTFMVLGQTVVVDNLTRFKGVTELGALVSGNVVEVSGFRDSSGDIRATFVEKRADTFVNGTSQIELKGNISAVDPVAMKIMIGSQAVDITNAVQIGFAAAPVVGDFVEGKGSSIEGSVLIADHLELESAALGRGDYDEAEIEGLVTSELNASSEFYLGAQLVRITGDTEFNGGLAADIVPGTRLEVEGRLNSGVLVAKEINFEDGIELGGDVASVAGSVVTLLGLPGIPVEVDDVLTDFEGAALSVSELKVGQHLQVRGRKGLNSILATRVVTTNESSDQVTVQGPVQSINKPYVQVLGLIVDTTGLTLKLKSSEVPVSAGTFFSVVQSGDLLEMEGSWSGGGEPVWRKVELDD